MAVRCQDGSADTRIPDPLMQCPCPSRAAWGMVAGSSDLPVARLKRSKATIDDGRRVGIDGPPVPSSHLTPTGCRRGFQCRQRGLAWLSVSRVDAGHFRRWCASAMWRGPVSWVEGRRDRLRRTDDEESKEFEWREARDRRTPKTGNKRGTLRKSCPPDPGPRHPTVAILAMQHLQRVKRAEGGMWDGGIGVGVMGHGGGKRANHRPPRIGDASQVPTIQPCDDSIFVSSGAV